MRAWLFSAAVAFLDEHLNAVPEAAEWLRSGALGLVSGGAVEISSKNDDLG